MGLDQYVFKRKSKEIAYWRKFNALQGWMEDLWKEKGGEGTFNCVDVSLDEEDLDRLEDDIKNNRLQPREGFFFGAQEIHPDDIHYTMKFILEARQALQEGYEVVYTSWW